MLSKVDTIKEALLRAINTGQIAPNEALPTRHALMERYGCARATVDAAIKGLIRDGRVYSSRGAGTFAAVREPRGEPRKAFIIGDYKSDETSERGSLALRVAAEIQRSRDCAITPPSEVRLRLDEMGRPGSAVIWMRPDPARLAEAEYLAACGTPQLIIGRAYGSFNHVTTDADHGVRRGLAWLRGRGVRRVAFISKSNDPEFPYVAERQIAFFRSCLELGLTPISDKLFFVSHGDHAAQINQIAGEMFKDGVSPDAIFNASMETLPTFLGLAESLGKRPGRDFSLLAFDHIPELDGARGVCMLRQRWEAMCAAAVEWFLKRSTDKTPFIRRIPPELISVNDGGSTPMETNNVKPNERLIYQC